MGSIFDTRITLETGSSGARTSAPACVLDGGFNDPIGEVGLVTDLLKKSFVVKVRDLHGLEPSVGDVLEMRDGSRYAIYRVSRLFDREVTMEARKC